MPTDQRKTLPDHRTPPERGRHLLKPIATSIPGLDPKAAAAIAQAETMKRNVERIRNTLNVRPEHRGALLHHLQHGGKLSSEKPSAVTAAPLISSFATSQYWNFSTSAHVTRGSCAPEFQAEQSVGVPCTLVGRRRWTAADGAVMVVACVRRVREALEARAIQHIDELSARLRSSAVYLFDDDDKDVDGTRGTLLRWVERRPRVHIIVAQPPQAWKREERLSLGRNALFLLALETLPKTGGHMR